MCKVSEGSPLKGEGAWVRLTKRVQDERDHVTPERVRFSFTLNFHSQSQFIAHLLFSISCSWDFVRSVYSQVNLLLGGSLSGFLFLTVRRIFFIIYFLD